ncbi:hypothetical protein BH23GEM2_BH23GEM2_09550 [soil metagenome]
MGLRSMLAVVSVLFGCASLQAQPGQGACLPADDKAENLRLILVTIASSPDPEDRALRDSLRVPATTADSVVQILDEDTCPPIIAAADLGMGAEQPLRRSAYVFRVGNVFVVYDPITDSVGGYVVFLDNSLVFLNVLKL